MTTPAAGKAYRTTGAAVSRRRRRPGRRRRPRSSGSRRRRSSTTARARCWRRGSTSRRARVPRRRDHLLRPAGAAGRRSRAAAAGSRSTFSRNGRPLLSERGRFDGGGPVHGARWGLGGATVLSLVVASPAPAGGDHRRRSARAFGPAISSETAWPGHRARRRRPRQRRRPFGVPGLSLRRAQRRTGTHLPAGCLAPHSPGGGRSRRGGPPHLGAT